MFRFVAVMTFLAIFALALPVVAATDPDALSEQATIRRDTFGVPHILAETEAAAALANGYVAAEDHCLEIARLYLKAKSREASHFGKEFAEADLWMKVLGLHEAAAAGYEQSPEWVQAILDGYAAGFNRYIEQHRRDLPEWVESVTGVDVLAHAMRVVNIEFALDSRQVRLARRSAEPTPGSNMYAVNRQRSSSGHAMLVGNPHLAWFGSQVWHELHITVPGVVNAYGASLIGLPGIELGFNENLGWSHTVNPHDATDVFRLTPAPGDSEGYLFDGQRREMTKRDVSIEVLEDGRRTTRRHTVLGTHLGPVVAAGPEGTFALKTPSLGEYRMIEQWSRMAKARNLAGFKETLGIQGISMFNIAYADVDGNCFYISNGRFPKRPAGYDWSGIVPGDTSATEWTGILSLAELPQLTNPKGGYVHNSNNAPWYASLAAPMDRSPFPRDVFPDQNDLRSQLGLELIDSDSSLTFHEMLANKLNPRLLLADRVKDALIAAAEGDAALKEAVRVLRKWDNKVARGSRGAVLFVAFWELYEPRATRDFETDWDPARPMETPLGLGDPGLAAELLAEAAHAVQEKYGALDVAWGEVYRLRRGDLDVPIGGYDGDYAYRVIAFAPDADGKYKAVGGDSYVFGVEFSKPLRAVSVLPYGQSADPESPHHVDQAAMFADGRFKDIWFSEKAIAKHIERSYRP